MRKLPVLLQETAKQDIADIRNHIESRIGSRSIARAIAKRIIKRTLRIGHVPHGGRPRDDLAVGLRTVPFEDKAMIVYRVEKNRVVIIRIFYGGRDWETIFTAGAPDPGG